ncbi:hypothetical protein BGP77_17460 [Saccharospirillum sp. MSK14-1]|uniref:hypothetical protein n=1 Tax=Saccharospirillum sp. MSK14-1 TaxID=1897632 RepID=UPI000D3A7A0B|nr:hypothetical protein [Saccharospirillum sp. MSK14-1]PTY38231.1 hypothetical protein BGP77_17460 [Saccharospirillum sp. MSK14-1]
MNTTPFLVTAALMTAAPLCAQAEDDPFADAFNDAFENVRTDAPEQQTLYVSHRLFTGGQLNLAHDQPEAGETDHRGLSGLTTGWQPRLEWRPNDALDAVLDVRLEQDWVFALKPDADWQDDYRDKRETRLAIEQATLGYRSLRGAASVGKQTLAWGFNDVLSVNEPVNPPKRSQPGLQDPDDAFVPRWLTEGRYYMGDWTVQGVIALDNPVAEQPVFGSDYYPMPTALNDQTPASPFEDAEALSGGVRFSGLLFGADAGAFVWRGYNSAGHIQNGRRQYERLTQVGGGFSVPVEPAVLKAELRWEDGLVFADQATERLAWTLGADITLPADSRLIIEHQSRYLPGYQSAMASIGDEFEQQWALGLEHSRWNERLTFKAMVLGFGNDLDNGQVMRTSAEWTVSDHWQTEVGGVIYRDGDAALPSLAADNDRLYWRLDYRF